jgi:hypothetical protein
MILVHEYQVFGPNGLFDLLKIFRYIFFPIPNVIACIQAVIRRITYAALPGKDAMNKLSIQ